MHFVMSPRPQFWTQVNAVHWHSKSIQIPMSRPAIFRALPAPPTIPALCPFLSQIHSKDVPARLRADLWGGEGDDPLSLEGAHQG